MDDYWNSLRYCSIFIVCFDFENKYLQRKSLSRLHVYTAVLDNYLEMYSVTTGSFMLGD